MSTYLISYDLRKPGRNYDGLYSELKSFSKWAHPLESFWAVVSSSSSADIRDQLVRHLDQNDALIVVKSANSGAWFGLKKQTSDWLKENL